MGKSKRYFEVEAKLHRAAALHQDGRLVEAESLYGQVLKVQPERSDALHHYGLLKHQLGQYQTAETLIRKAVKLEPNPYYLNNLGEACRAQGKWPEAEAAYRDALTLAPNLIQAWGNLGTLLQDTGVLDEAANMYRRVLALDPVSVPALLNLGEIYEQQSRIEEAQQCYRKAEEVAPNVPEVLLGLGNIQFIRGEYTLAAEQYHRAVTLDAALPSAWLKLGNALFKLKRDEAALEAWRNALRLKPDYFQVYLNIGTVYQEQGKLDEAMQCYEQSLRVQPGYSDALISIASCAIAQGKVMEAINTYKKLLEKECQNQRVVRSLLLSRLYLPGDPETLFAENLALVAPFEGQALPIVCAAPECLPEKKLRIGYVSSDFREHPVAFNLQPIIERHDRSRIEIYCYGNIFRPDAMTEWFKQQANGWRSIVGLSDEKAARLIREDKIDILVFLAGRFDHNRPFIATCRAAPVQVSLHDPATSGVSEMDYLIADSNLAPRNTQERFTERIVRLPTFYLHSQMRDMPDVSSLPGIKAGYITFGSFNNPAKVNEQVVKLWANVLIEVPNSKLLLKYRAAYGVPSVRERYLRLFEGYGVSVERVTLMGEIETRDRHLQQCAEIDIALDPFPFTGSTTTFEALWMGVPVVTLVGETMVSRWSASMLRRVGLEELIAHTPEDYVRIAQTLAQDLPRLAELRRTLRERVADSPLCDARARTRQLERAYRWMWRKWCAEHGG